jgi:2-polyprenyl-3-methyl-5-hydroxy-6-metoxy-1,4-benzoquinol methylase
LANSTVIPENAADAAVRDTLARVAAQYEALPYPTRDPAEEDKRLIGTWLDDLDLINHRCFYGARRFDAGIRILVAGGGTGDGTIFLAQQLRERGIANARVVHLDVSQAAIDVAKARAARRGLTGIEFVKSSLLDLPALDLGRFDYVNCVGVLHHLPDPEAGLQALMSCLAEDGAMAILLYARIGRLGIYQAQALLRQLLPLVPHLSPLDVCKQMLAKLPKTNWLARSSELHPDLHFGGDAGLYDLLLHAQDRAYDVPEIYAWFRDQAGLHPYFSDVHRGRLPYQPTQWLSEPHWQSALSGVCRERGEQMAEQLGGDLVMHAFFATRAIDPHAPYGDADYVPFFLRETHPASGESLVEVIDSHRGQPFLLTHSQSGLRRVMHPTQMIRAILMYIDGRRTWHEIFMAARTLVQKSNACASSDTMSDEKIFAEFEPWYVALNSIERLLLRKLHL